MITLNEETVGLAHEAYVTVMIPALAVVALSIPVMVKPAAEGVQTIELGIWVGGWRGRRVRPRRAREYERKVTGGMQALALAGGMVVWGGGLRLAISVDGSKSPPEMAGAAAHSVVWPPEQGARSS